MFGEPSKLLEQNLDVAYVTVTTYIVSCTELMECPVSQVLKLARDVTNALQAGNRLADLFD